MIDDAPALPRERLCFMHLQGRSDGIHGSLADVLDRSFSVYIGTTFRRADFAAVGGFDPSMTHAEDLDLWVRLLELGGSACYVDRVLGEYRVRPHSASDNPVRLLEGNLKVYLKAQQRLPAAHPVQGVITAMLAETRQALDFEHALLRIAGGAENFWNSPSRVSFICSTRAPSTSRARRSSHSRPQPSYWTKEKPSQSS